MSTPVKIYDRVVLKVSGESLGSTTPLDVERFSEAAMSVAELHGMDVDVMVIVGGGNLFRGPLQHREWGLDPAYADEVGMYVTGVNAMLLAGRLHSLGIRARVFSRGPCTGVGQPYDRQAVRDALDSREVTILAGGMGVAGISTDVPTVAAAVDIAADAVIMFKHGVDGVYDSDPRRNPHARFLPELKASTALAGKLAVMDTAALALARDHHKIIHVVPASEPSAAKYVIEGKEIGSKVIPI